MQGKVTDGQYLNDPFLQAINSPIIKQLQEANTAFEPFWWPCQWDSSHCLDKIFSKFKSEKFVSTLLNRVGLYNQIFGIGKMHSIAKQTSKEINTDFRVTIAFAHQRFS